MAISAHPLSNAKLGEFINSYTRKKDKGGLITVFMYKNGIILLNNEWKWQTIMDDEDGSNAAICNHETS